MPPYWKMAGTVTTTISTRSECAAATWSMRAPLRSARLAISEAPPMAVEKNAVLKATPVVRRSRMAPPAPSTSANSEPAMM
ncbi:hypothetical protein D3C72_1757080 [compost metagenome]